MAKKSVKKAVKKISKKSAPKKAKRPVKNVVLRTPKPIQAAPLENISTVPAASTPVGSTPLPVSEPSSVPLLAGPAENDIKRKKAQVRLLLSMVLLLVVVLVLLFF